MLSRVLPFLRPPAEGGPSLVVSSVWSLLLRIAGMAVTFVVGVQLARYLGPSGFGIYGVVIAIMMLLNSAAQLGLPTLSTRETAVAWSRGNWPRLRGVIRWFAVAVGTTGLLLAALFVLAAQLWPGADAQFRAAAWWGAALVPVFSLTVLVSAELRGLDRLVIGQSLEIFVRPAAMSVLCIAAFVMRGSMDAPLALALNFASAAVALLLGFYLLHRRLPAAARQAFPERHGREWRRAGLPLALSEVLRQLEGTYALLIVGALATAAETGLFRVAASCALVVATPLSVLHVVLAPTLARLHKDGEREKLARLLTIAARIMLAASVAALLFLAVAGHFLISLMFGAQYAGSALPLVVLVAAQGVGAYFGVGFVLLAMGESERQLSLCYLAAVVVGVTAAIPLTLAWGATGAAAAAVAGGLANNGLAWYFVRRRMGLDCSALGLSIRGIS